MRAGSLPLVLALLTAAAHVDGLDDVEVWDKSTRPTAPRPGALQVVHAPPPSEQNWVLVAGNESAVDTVLAISLGYGGRLVSMGHYVREGVLHYYAIMHKFNGPVFLKPSPMTYGELSRTAKENELRDLAPTQICGHEDRPGRVTFSTYWEKIPGVQFQIWFPGAPSSDMQRRQLETNGYRLTYLCGYSVEQRAQYVGVWQKPALSTGVYEAHYGLLLENCMAKDRALAQRGFVATQFRVFTNRRQVLCTGIWEYRPGSQHSIALSNDLAAMYRKYESQPEMLPRQISHYMDMDRSVRFVVLWSDLHSYRYPEPPELWNTTSKIPVRYLKGSPELLDDEKLDFIVKRVEHFMKDLNIPGLSVAISKKEQLKFAAGFGFADVRGKEPVTPNHQFRVGSVSKPITAAAILALVDDGKIDLDEPLFGKDSIFGMEFAKDRSYRKFVTEVSIRHLLEHTAGGWDNLESDAAWIEPQMTTKELIAHVLEEYPLQHRPGTNWVYSNFGYQLLGHVIERVSGKSYEQFVREAVWSPSGVEDVRLAGPTISDRAPREVIYYMSGNKIGFNPYDMLASERIGPWGGWIASPIQLLRFMAHVDGFKKRKDILSDESIKEWATPTAASNDTYGLGWSLNIMGFNGWQHDGRMPGSAAMLVRLDNGLQMAVVVNKEYSERDFFHELGYVLHHIGNNCDWWNEQKFDLFEL